MSQLATSGILASKNRIECYFGKLVFTSVILACSVFTSGILAILSSLIGLLDPFVVLVGAGLDLFAQLFFSFLL